MHTGDARRLHAARVFTAIWSVLALATGVRAAGPVVEFEANIPSAPAEMQVFDTKPVAPPLEFLNQKLRAIDLPALKMEENNLHISRAAAAGALEPAQVHAIANATTGEVHLLPNLAKLVETGVVEKEHKLAAINEVAKAALLDKQFIPRDATELRVAAPVRVLGLAATGREVPARAEPKVILTFVPATRYAAGLRVYGLGSHALIAVGNNQNVVGALRRWNSATVGQKITPTITVEQVRAEIERQLKPNVPDDAKAVVDLVTPAYYDGQGKYLQPVYRFEANVLVAKNGKLIARIGGYIPLGKVLEPIPDLAAKPRGAGPKIAVNGAVPEMAEEKREARAEALIKPVVTVGEFVNQDWPHSSAYLDMANNFMSGLNSGNAPVTFSRTLWWTAYSWQVNGPQSKNFMNAVNIAYTEPHGDWLLNTCLSNDSDFWYVDKIGAGGNPGFGAAAGGVLSTWVIMSCEVIPSYYDRQHEVGGDGNGQHCFDAWWGVFQGLHSAVGFRTIMFYPDDALNYGFGHLAATGADVQTAWFQEVAAYHSNEGTYTDEHINMTVHYDRASMMIDARNLGQPIYNVKPQSKASTLWNFWMDN